MARGVRTAAEPAWARGLLRGALARGLPAGPWADGLQTGNASHEGVSLSGAGAGGTTRGVHTRAAGLADPGTAETEPDKDRGWLGAVAIQPGATRSGEHVLALLHAVAVPPGGAAIDDGGRGERYPCATSTATCGPALATVPGERALLTHGGSGDRTRCCDVCLVIEGGSGDSPRCCKAIGGSGDRPRCEAVRAIATGAQAVVRKNCCGDSVGESKPATELISGGACGACIGMTFAASRAICARLGELRLGETVAKGSARGGVAPRRGAPVCGP